MKIKKIVVYPNTRKIKIELDNNKYIIYTKFASDLFCGNRISEGISKESPILHEIKRKALQLEYFNNNTINIPLADIIAAEKELKQFENKEVNIL